MGITAGTVPLEDGALLVAGEGASRHHAGNAEIVLHRRLTEGVLTNLQSPEPVLYVVMRPDDGALGWRLHLVTASDYEAQDHSDAGEDEVGRVPMPPELRAPIEVFVTAHHAEEPRHKRKRKVDAGDAHKFGREPVWTLPEGALDDGRLDRPREARSGEGDGGARGPNRAKGEER